MRIHKKNTFSESDEPSSNANDKENIVPLTGLSSDPDVNLDAKFVDDFQKFLKSHKTSKLFTPFMSQLKKKNRA